ncbi:type IV toxin-antitoxin system AbiEi family antitoxin domain-containing protein [Rothia dentocariosa]|uniref:type IV toxin-antitoxin system AbiEi family antitoxin domain-containing protein n=1 Tax=Rothia dentocariosa TaxID=2047 RepID=UPI0028800FFE|nr:type IV toxin-antitoxin system AbiEi family antitoxin domain-containing protein [Rothia dentocariosa]
MTTMKYIIDSIKTYSDLIAEGYSERYLAKLKRSNTIFPLVRGVYVSLQKWSSWSTQEQNFAYHVAAARRAPQLTFTRESAAFLHGIPLLQMPQKIHAATSKSVRRGARTRVMYHVTTAEVQERAVWIEEFLRTLNPLDTLVDCARNLPFYEACCIGDGILHRGLVTFAEVQESLTAVSRRGSAKARKVAEAVDERSGSVAETITRLHLSAHGFPVPELQYKFTHRGRNYYSDFAWKEYKLVLEIDGRMKYRGTFGIPTEEALIAEREREKIIQNQGWHVVRAHWEDLYPTSAGLRDILVPYLKPVHFPACRTL